MSSEDLLTLACTDLILLCKNAGMDKLDVQLSVLEDEGGCGKWRLRLERHREPVYPRPAQRPPEPPGSV